MSLYSGFFLTFDGIEGTGKSTHARRLFTFLKDSGYSPLLTSEPGGTDIGEKIRALLLHPETGEVDPWTEVFLFEASRREHIIRVIRPALEKGQIVICVRFNDSTLAYQGYGRGLPITTLDYLNQLTTEGLTPDLTVLLDIDPEEGLKRSLYHTSPEELRFEEEFIRKKEILTAIREGFFQIAEQEPDRIRMISTAQPKDVVFETIKQCVLAAIHNKNWGDVP